MKQHSIKPLFEAIELYSIKDRREEKIIFEGNNIRHALIICQNGLTLDDKAFLARILGSLKMDLADIALMTDEHLLPFHQLKSEMPFKTMILFGVKPEQLQLNINYTKYLPFQFRDTWILASDSLPELDGNEPSKKLLWIALKKMFAENAAG